jgi:hypothetical protein
VIEKNGWQNPKIKPFCAGVEEFTDFSVAQKHSTAILTGSVHTEITFEQRFN